MFNFFNQFNKVFVIAEIGSNHNGSFDLAKEMIEAAAQAGVDAVKFQTYRAENLITRDIPVFPRARPLGYQTQFDRFRDLEFSQDQFHELAGYAHKNKIIFLSTPFDLNSVDLLDPLVPAFKIASADLINFQLLRYVASKNKPVILSTGQAVVEEIDSAIAIFSSQQVSLLHCVSAYPTNDAQANLLSIPFLRSRYKINVGYSDHTIGTLACLAAVALGAIIIEKHFTFDKTQPFGDHVLSADPIDLRLLIQDIRRLEKMLGSEKKFCQDCESFSKTNLRRSLHAQVDISAGTIIKNEMIVSVISGKGIPANYIDQIIGKKILNNLCKGEVFTENNFEQEILSNNGKKYEK